MTTWRFVSRTFTESDSMPVFRFLGDHFVMTYSEDGPVFVEDAAYYALGERFHWCLDHHAELSDAQLEQFVNFVTGRSWLDFPAADDDAEADEEGENEVSMTTLAHLWFGNGEEIIYNDYHEHDVSRALFRFARVAVLPRNANSAHHIVDEIWEHWFDQCDEPVESVVEYLTSDNRDDWAPFFATADDDWMPEVRAYFAAAADADAGGPEQGLVPSMAVLTI
jgi:hypothetical protein